MTSNWEVLQWEELSLASPKIPHPLPVDYMWVQWEGDTIQVRAWVKGRMVEDSTTFIRPDMLKRSMENTLKNFWGPLFTNQAIREALLVSGERSQEVPGRETYSRIFLPYQETPPTLEQCEEWSRLDPTPKKTKTKSDPLANLNVLNWLSSGCSAVAFFPDFDMMLSDPVAGSYRVEHQVSRKRVDYPIAPTSYQKVIVFPHSNNLKKKPTTVTRGWGVNRREESIPHKKSYVSVAAYESEILEILNDVLHPIIQDCEEELIVDAEALNKSITVIASLGGSKVYINVSDTREIYYKAESLERGTTEGILTTIRNKEEGWLPWRATFNSDSIRLLKSLGTKTEPVTLVIRQVNGHPCLWASNPKKLRSVIIPMES